MSEESEESERDRKEAAALRRALEEGVGGEDVPREALEAAALIRYGAAGGEIDPAAKQRILDELVQAQARRVRPRRRPAWTWIAGLAGGVIVVVVVAAGGSILMKRSSRAPAGPSSVLPRPPAALLRAQAEAAAPGAHRAEALEREMRPYRRAVLESLRSGRTAEIESAPTEWMAGR